MREIPIFANTMLFKLLFNRINQHSAYVASFAHCKIPPNSQDFYAEYDVITSVLLKILTLCNMVWNFPELMHNVKILRNCNAVSCYTPF